MEKIPAYKKCYNKLKSDIDNNVYPIGSYLPTEDELGKMFSVSRTTVRHAIDLLVKDKRIKVKQGAGHADYPAAVKFHGAQAASGGGHFSGRLTAPLCVAGMLSSGP